jgi:hypothetical protein
VGGQVRLFARKPHYRDHLRPIWNLIPDEYKLTGEWGRFDRLLIAGAPDIRHGHPYIYVEHGSGQSFVGLSSNGYSGGSGHDACELFICPSQAVADRWTARYPSTPTAVVGCPRLDRWHTGYEPPGKTVALAFHWDCKIIPETRSAFPHYQNRLDLLVQSYRAQGWSVVGTCHPRYRSTVRPVYEKLGVPWVDEALDTASVLVADATSLCSEFLSCGRPVVCLAAPWYRRDVHHGLWFWDLDATYVNEPEEAADIKLSELQRPTRHPYAFADGQAAERAATAIVTHLHP